MNHKLSVYQASLWLFAAITGPLVAYSNGNWLGILAIGAILSSLSWLSIRFGTHWEGRVYQIVQILWLCLILSQLLPFSADCWPTATHAYPMIPLTLLTLSAMTARRGSKSTANGMSILFWVVIVLIGVVIIAGMSDLRGKYLKVQSGMPKDVFYLIFLLPAVAAFLCIGEGGMRVLAVIPVFATGIAAWVAGSISPQLAEVVDWPFYEASKSVQLLGVAKRFEALVSVGITVGNYGLYSMLLCAIYCLGEKLEKGRESVTISALLAGSLMLTGITLTVKVMIAVSFVLWIFLPLLGIFKTGKNSEKTCK